MGPEASVILGTRLDASQRETLDEMIRSVSTRRAAGQFFVRTTAAVGGSYEREPWEEDWPFEVSVAERADESTDEVDRFRNLIEDAFGVRPGDSIRLSAWRNGDGPHRILGELCLAFAERFGGIISFGGALEPRRYDLYGIEADWADVAPYSDAMLAGMPGKLLAVPYRTARDTDWVSHFGDSTFMRAWLSHPGFHMIK
jgi:hypothetical protein